MIIRISFLIFFVSWLAFILSDGSDTVPFILQVIVLTFMIVYLALCLCYQARIRFDSEFIYVKKIWGELEKVEYHKIFNIELNNRNGFPPGTRQYLLEYKKAESTKKILFDLDDLSMKKLVRHLKEKGIRIALNEIV